MYPDKPSERQSKEHVRNIALDLVYTIISCGLFNLYVQYRQILAVNAMLHTKKYQFWKWLLLTLVTCGLFHIYHEYRMSEDLAALLKQKDSHEPLITVILTAFGLSIVADAIQQAHINRYYGSSSL